MEKDDIVLDVEDEEIIEEENIILDSEDEEIIGKQKNKRIALISPEDMLKKDISIVAVDNHISDEFIPLFARINNMPIYQIELGDLIIDEVNNYNSREIFERYKQLNDKESYYLLNYITRYNTKEITDTKENRQLYDDISNLIFKTNLRLALSCAYKLVRQIGSGSYDVNDFISEGMLGLKRSIISYNQNKADFSTYAYIWMKQKITHFRNSGDLVRIPVHANEKYLRIKKFKREFYADNLCEPTIEEIINNVGCTHADIITMEKYSSFASLDSTYGEDNDTTLGDMVSTKNNDIEKMMDNEHNVIKLQNLICLLDKEIKNDNSKEDEKEKERVNRQKVILICRYGLTANNMLNTNDFATNDNEIQVQYLTKMYHLNDDAINLLRELYTGEPMTLEEIGSKMGVTRERIRQIEAKAFNRLKVFARREKEKEKFSEKVIVKQIRKPGC